MDPFWYDLPSERIAQRPVYPPESAKMLVWSGGGQPKESRFENLLDYLTPDDVLVFNNTKVIPARLLGSLNGNPAEILLLEKLGADCWSCLGRPMRQLVPGARIEFESGLVAVVEKVRGPRDILVRFEALVGGSLDELIKASGVMPIPPYIRKGLADEQDRLDYQTIFASQEGSVAAPTASLHFSKDLMERLHGHVAAVEFVTLHVGAASFLALRAEEGQLLPPGSERFIIEEQAVGRLRQYKREGKNIVAVGTTAVRALETMSSEDSAGNCNVSGYTELFIQPGYNFKMVDKLITNFHQPGTTHLLLVEALMGRVALASVYDFALQSDFRFLSYGDGMLLVP